MPAHTLRNIAFTLLVPLLVSCSFCVSLADEAELNDSDRYSLDQIANACSSEGSMSNEAFADFFDAFIRSKAARVKYSAAQIHYTVYSGGRVLSDEILGPGNYTRFPVQMVDYYYKPVTPAFAGDEDEYLDIQFNQSQTGDFSVDWARVHFDGQSEGGDNLGNPLGADGKPLARGAHPDPEGQLLFQAVGSCWKFVSDVRFKADR